MTTTIDTERASKLTEYCAGLRAAEKLDAGRLDFDAMALARKQCWVSRFAKKWLLANMPVEIQLAVDELVGERTQLVQKMKVAVDRLRDSNRQRALGDAQSRYRSAKKAYDEKRGFSLTFRVSPAAKTAFEHARSEFETAKSLLETIEARIAADEHTVSVIRARLNEIEAEIGELQARCLEE